MKGSGTPCPGTGTLQQIDLGSDPVEVGQRTWSSEESRSRSQKAMVSERSSTRILTPLRTMTGVVLEGDSGPGAKIVKKLWQSGEDCTS